MDNLKKYRLLKNGVPTGDTITAEQPHMTHTLDFDHPMVKVVEKYRSPSLIAMPTENVIVFGVVASPDVYQFVEEGYEWLPQSGTVGRAN